MSAKSLKLYLMAAFSANLFRFFIFLPLKDEQKKWLVKLPEHKLARSSFVVSEKKLLIASLTNELAFYISIWEIRDCMRN